MSPPIDVAAATSVIAAQAGKAVSPKSSAISPVNFEKYVHIARIETDDMVKCTPKIIRKRNHIISEKVIIAHLVDDNGTLKITPI